MINKHLFAISILTLLVFCFAFISCKDTPDDNFSSGGVNPNPGKVKGLEFSHKSGLYRQSFNLTLTAENNYEIYYSIDGSIPSKNADGKRVFKYNSPVSIKNRTGEPNFIATKENIPFFYPGPEDRFDDPPIPFIPENLNERPKSMVIRAAAFDSNGVMRSAVATLTYFIGNIMDKYAGHPVISIVTDPKNLLDANIGIYVRGYGKSQYEYNFYKKGRDWEREANIDFFDSSRRVAFSTGAGIRVRGGWSRDAHHKSWNVYFRQEYGIDYLINYPLIPGAVRGDGVTSVVRNKNFMLRNGGNDTDITKLRDVYIQSLLKDRNFTTQAGIPCVVYLNGEYWGFYNLQEKYSNHHLENKFGVNRNNVIIIENWELDEGTQSELDEFNSKMNYFGNNNMKDANIYAEFCDFFDVQSYIDYFAANIYIWNQDWPNNNWQLWRTRNKEPNNFFGDQRWRWQMFDVEFSMGIYRDGRVVDYDKGVKKDSYDKILDTSDHNSSKLFLKLMENDEFFKLFIITLMDLYNVNFDYAQNAAKLDEMAADYGHLMVDYQRWFGSSWKPFDIWISEMKSYLWNIKDELTNGILPNHFSDRGITADKLANVTLYTDAPGISIGINTTKASLASGSWIGKYFSSYPVTVTAPAAAGNFNFNGWTVAGGNIISGTSASDTITVSFNGDVQIKASYSGAAWASLPGTEVQFNSENGKQTAKININKLGINSINKNDMYLLDITDGYLNKDIFSLSSARISLVQGEGANERVIAYDKPLLGVTPLSGGVKFNNSAFFIADQNINTGAVYLKIEINSSGDSVKFKYKQLKLTKSANRRVILTKDFAAQDWTDSFRAGQLGLNNITAGKNYKVTITGTSPAAIQQLIMRLTDENGNAISSERIFPVTISANKQFSASAVVKASSNGNNLSFLEIKTRGNAFPGRITPVIIDCAQFTLAETTEGSVTQPPRNLEFKADRFINWENKDTGEWKANIQLNDYYKGALKPNTKYKITITGNLNASFNNVTFNFGGFNNSDPNNWNNWFYIGWAGTFKWNGAINETIIFTTSSDFDSNFAFSRAYLDIVESFPNPNSVPESDNGKVKAVISNFSMVFDEE